jgi:hypothetical protein
MNQPDKTNGEHQRAPLSQSDPPTPPGRSQASRATPQKPKPTRSIGCNILDVLDFLLRLFLGSRFAVLSLLCCIAGVVILVTSLRHNFSYGMGLLALGLVVAGVEYWRTGGHS